MKWVFILSTLMVLATAEETENDFWTDMGALEDLTNNQVKLTEYLHCFIDQGTCDKDSADFKKILPEAFSQACAKCTTGQRFFIYYFIDAFKDKEPEAFGAFLQKYDPENKYLEALKAATNHF